MSNSISKSMKKKVFEKSGGLCWYCGKDLNVSEQLGWNENEARDMFTVDHIQPNKENSFENLVPCCLSCNAKKNKHSLERFRYVMTYPPQFRFTENQLEYLRSLGLDIKATYIFYFEKAGLK